MKAHPSDELRLADNFDRQITEANNAQGPPGAAHMPGPPGLRGGRLSAVARVAEAARAARLRGKRRGHYITYFDLRRMCGFQAWVSASRCAARL